VEAELSGGGEKEVDRGLRGVVASNDVCWCERGAARQREGARLAHESRLAGRCGGWARLTNSRIDRSGERLAARLDEVWEIRREPEEVGEEDEVEAG
jgi:hypothetical protein